MKKEIPTLLVAPVIDSRRAAWHVNNENYVDFDRC